MMMNITRRLPVAATSAVSRCLLASSTRTRTVGTISRNSNKHHLLASSATKASGSSTSSSIRLLSTTTPSEGSAGSITDDPVTIKYSPPDKLTTEMANGIADATYFYIRCGLSNQRLKDLANNPDINLVTKWQKMMEIFLATQVHVIAGIGYAGSEDGLTRYAHDLATCIQNADEATTEYLQKVRRDTWRELVATCFNLEVDDIPTLSIVDARNLMHKVSTKMIEPDTLMEIQQKASKIQDPNTEIEVAKKHAVLQEVIVNTVYMGGSPSLIEETGFGSGPEAYAKLQCALSDHEGDPLIAQYAGSAMMKIWEYAGLDISSLQGAGGSPPPS